jgi:hypothetical protein
VGDEPGSPKEEGEEKPTDSADPKPEAATTTPSRQREEDNEFIFDGFDFSTGLSICQALDLDEDEPNNPTVDKSPLIAPRKGVTDPSELGNVLLKALGVNKGGSVSADNKAPPPHSATATDTGDLIDICVPPCNLS